MMKKIVAIALAALMLFALVACGGKEDQITDDPVINIGAQYLTYTDDDGNTFTYDYRTSTTVEITAFSGSDEPHAVTIPATIGDYTVASIADRAFFSYSNLSSVTLPEGLVEIGEYAFANCEVLTAVTFPSTLETVGTGAFYGCDTLGAIDLAGTATSSIKANAFADCPMLTAVAFPATLTDIAEYAFANCTALTAITLPEGVTSVGAQAFYNCTAVEALTLPASLVEIGDWAFNPTARDLEDTAITVPEGSAAEAYVKNAR